MTPAAPAAKELTEAEMEKKTKAIVDEYLQIQDMKVKYLDVFCTPVNEVRSSIRVL